MNKCLHSKKVYNYHTQNFCEESGYYYGYMQITTVPEHFNSTVNIAYIE